DQSEKRAIAIEAPRPAGLDQLKARLVVPIEDLLPDLAAGPAIDQGQRVRAVPLRIHDGDRRVREDAAYAGVGGQVFKSHVDSQGELRIAPMAEPFPRCLRRFWRLPPEVVDVARPGLPRHRR